MTLDQERRELGPDYQDHGVLFATGRDYADVAPASGSYVGASPGRLTAARRVGVLSAA